MLHKQTYWYAIKATSKQAYCRCTCNKSLLNDADRILVTKLCSSKPWQLGWVCRLPYLPMPPLVVVQHVHANDIESMLQFVFLGVCFLSLCSEFAVSVILFGGALCGWVWLGVSINALRPKRLMSLNYRSWDVWWPILFGYLFRCLFGCYIPLLVDSYPTSHHWKSPNIMHC